MIIVGTAGHIDHGKTTLVGSLTGIDTDRLKEEKQRGISIELGFAYLDLPGDQRVGLIDVPGHEKFVHHMIAGATGVDLVMLVIAADEGIMPQTKEHLSICRLLGMERGVVVLTKTDLVDEEWLELVADDIQEYLSDTFLADAPMLQFSSTWQGEELERFKTDLFGQLSNLTGSLHKTALDRPLMLPVDRVFTIKGFGTVVTGTLQTGRLSAGDQLSVLPSRRAAKVRRLEIHGAPAEQSTAGFRTAVNLPDLQKNQVQRGNVLAFPDSIDTTDRLTCALDTVGNLEKKLKGQFKALFHTGASLAEASVRIMGPSELGPGESALITVRLPVHIAVLPGNRFILRGFSHMAEFGRTLGGGTILWPDTIRAREANLAMLEQLKTGQPELQIQAAAFLRGANGVPLEALPYLTLLTQPQLKEIQEVPIPGTVRLTIGGKGVMMHEQFFQRIAEQVMETVTQYHGRFPRKKGMPREELKSSLPPYIDRDIVMAVVARIEEEGRLAGDELRVREQSFQPRLDARFVEELGEIETMIKRGGTTPPVRDVLLENSGMQEDELADALALLQEEGRIEKISSDLFYHVTAADSAREQVVSFMQKNDNKATTQELKDVLHLSRKYLIPLLEYFDATRLTARVGSAQRRLR